MATASFDDIRRSFLEAHITLMVRPGRDSLVDGLDSFDELLVDDSHQSLRAFARKMRAIRGAGFDLVVLFTNSFRTALLVGLAGVPLRVGYRKGGQEVFLTHVIEPPLEPRTLRWSPRPMSEIYADLCFGFGVEPGDGRPRLAVSTELEQQAADKRRELGIGDGEKLIGLAPGAAFGGSKVWPPAKMARLADRLSESKGKRCLLIAGPGEEAIADELVAHMKSEVINTAPSPLGLALLKPFVRDLDLLVTMDSGPRHFGAAFRVPTMVIMGPTDPRWTASNLDDSDVVRHDVPCGPCQLPVCPLDHRCMTEITPEEVFERVTLLEDRLRASASS
jgi:heptosyltransferase-2